MSFKIGVQPDNGILLIAESLVAELPSGAVLSSGHGLIRIHFDYSSSPIIAFHDTVAELFSSIRSFGPGPNGGSVYEYVNQAFPENLIEDLKIDLTFLPNRVPSPSQWYEDPSSQSLLSYLEEISSSNACHLEL